MAAPYLARLDRQFFYYHVLLGFGLVSGCSRKSFVHLAEWARGFRRYAYSGDRYVSHEAVSVGFGETIKKSRELRAFGVRWANIYIIRDSGLGF